MISPHFLTEYVTLITKGPMVDDNDETLNELRLFYGKRGIKVEPSSDIIPVLYHYGINLDHSEYTHPKFGNANPHLYTKLITDRRVECENPGWLVKNLAKYGGNFLFHLLKPPYLPNQLMELIWKLTDSPTGTPLDQIIVDRDKSLEINSDIQLPFISWLNKKELIQINSRLKELTPNKDIPDGKTLWEFTLAAQDIIKGWFVRNNLDVPEILAKSQRGGKTQRFRELMEKAIHCGQQTDDELRSWKDRFAEFQNGRYFPDIQEFGEFPQGPGSANGLEWRLNRKFRKTRSTASHK